MYQSLCLIQWVDRHEMLVGKHSLEVLRKVSERELASTQTVNVPSVEVGNKCINQLVRSYNKDYGGFSTAPKFPQPSIFNFLFHMYSRDRDSEQGKLALEMCLHTLQVLTSVLSLIFFCKNCFGFAENGLRWNSRSCQLRLWSLFSRLQMACATF